MKMYQLVSKKGISTNVFYMHIYVRKSYSYKNECRIYASVINVTSSTGSVLKQTK